MCSPTDTDAVGRYVDIDLELLAVLMIPEYKYVSVLQGYFCFMVICPVLST